VLPEKGEDSVIDATPAEEHSFPLQRKGLIKMSAIKPKSIGQAVIDGDLKFKPWLTQFSPEIFEVSFSNIIRGRGPDMYLTPEKFYENTQMTKRMKDVLQMCLSRTASQINKGTIYLATSFGGGKSHLLTLLYHTFKSGEIIDQQYLAEINLKEVPEAKVVAVDGHNLTYPIRNDNALKKYIKETMEATLKALEAEGRPIVILLDELVVYLAKQNADKQRNEMANLHTLMMAVNSSSNCVMVITNPSGSQVYGKEVETLDALLTKTRQTEIAQNISSLLSRVTEPIIPVGKGDFVAILRKRLIESIDQDTAKKVEVYLEGKLPGLTFTNFYPFHPMLIDVLYDRISLFPDFQKTRDVLKIIALAIKGILNHKESAAFYVISPSDFYFDDPSLRAILTNEKVFGSNLEQAVTEDVIAAALEADQNQVFGIFGRIASTVFMYSLHIEPSKVGVTHDTVFKCLTDALTENDVKTMIHDFYDKFSTFMWHIESRYLFKSKQNVPHLVKIREQRISRTLTKNYIEKTLYGTLFSRASDAYCTFYQPNEYTPTPYRLNVIVPFYWDNVPEIVSTRLSILGDVKNTILILIPDAKIRGSVDGFARRVIAAGQVEKMVREDKDQLEEAKRIKAAAESKALIQFKGMYTQITYLKGSTPQPVAIDLTRDQTISEVIINLCKRNQKVVDVENIDPKGYLETLLGIRINVTVRTLFDDVNTRTDIPFASRNDLRTIIAQGVYEGVIGLLQGSLPANQEFTGRERVFLRTSDQTIPVHDGDTVLTVEYAQTVIDLIRQAGDESGDGGGGGDGSPPLPPEFQCLICGERLPTQQDLDEHIQSEHPEGPEEEIETFTADAASLHHLLSDRWFEILLDETINVQITLQFTDQLIGIITAKTRSEISTMLTYTDGIYKARSILETLAVTVTIRKTRGGIN